MVLCDQRVLRVVFVIHCSHFGFSEHEVLCLLSRCFAHSVAFCLVKFQLTRFSRMNISKCHVMVKCFFVTLWSLLNHRFLLSSSRHDTLVLCFLKVDVAFVNSKLCKPCRFFIWKFEVVECLLDDLFTGVIWSSDSVLYSLLCSY